MLSRLSHGAASVKELATPLALALPSALKHLQILEQGGIVVSTKSGRVRTFTIEPEGFSALQSFINEHQRQLQLGFDRLSQLMAATPELPPK